MNPDLQRFWTERQQAHGHTGWTDPVVYAYDQLERLALIRAAISNKVVKNGLALDFGCGTGDFSRLLLETGFTVCGYDPFVRPKIRSGKFIYANTYEKIPFAQQAVDVVLAVTTLTHIIEEADLLDALAVIRKFIKPKGDVFMLEYALDSSAERDKHSLRSDYQTFRTVAEWSHLLGVSALPLLSITPFPQPFISPSTGFLEYRRTPLARIGRLCSRSRTLKLFYAPLLRWHAAKYVGTKASIANPEAPSPLKLIHCLLG